MPMASLSRVARWHVSAKPATVGNLALVAVAALTGCGALTSVDDNREVFCQKLLSVNAEIALATGVTDPALPVATASEQLTLAQSGLATAGSGASQGQKQLVNRTTKVMTQYRDALSETPQDATLADYETGLNAYQANVLANYQTMLENVGCILPAFYDSLPATE